MVQPNDPPDLGGTDEIANWFNLTEGTKVKLKNGAVAEVTANPQDGGWLFVRYLEHLEDPSQIGQDEMVFFVDVQAVL